MRGCEVDDAIREEVFARCAVDTGELLDREAHDDLRVGKFEVRNAAQKARRTLLETLERVLAAPPDLAAARARLRLRVPLRGKDADSAA